MKLKRVDIDIIYLLTRASDFLSSYEIAKQVGISRRLIRDEMQHIRQILREFGFTLESSVSKGYRIVLQNDKTFLELEEAIDQLETSYQSSIPQLPSERQNYLTTLLLKADGYFKIDDLAQELAVSRATISNDLKTCKIDLNERGITIRQKPNFGLKVEGNERAHRAAICDMDFTQFYTANLTNELLFTPDASLPEPQIIAIIENSGIELSDVSIVDFFLYISVMLQRVQKGYILTELPELPEIQDAVEFQAANQIADVLEIVLNTKLNEAERLYLGIELIARKEKIQVNVISKEECIQVVDEILDAIEASTMLSLRMVEKCVLYLREYLPGIIFRNKYRCKLRTPLFLILEHRFPLGYHCARIASEIIEKHYGFRMRSSELGNLSVSFTDAIYLFNNSMLEALLICGTRQSERSYIRHQLYSYFGTEIQFVKTLPFYRFKMVEDLEYDFIISTGPVPEVQSVPVVTISYLITAEDIRRVRNFLDRQFRLPLIQTICNPLLYQDHLVIKSVNQLINHFIDTITSHYRLSKNIIHTSIMFDEKKRQVVEFENGITLLRFNFPIEDSSFISILRSDEPFIFDKSKADVFIVCSLTEQSSLLFEALYQILHTLEKDTLNSTRLKTAQNYCEFIKVLVDIQKNKARTLLPSQNHKTIPALHMHA
ncbi:MAG: HTH domain-containing protein [Erysipelotrichaceae bacterium]|jgi:lichenan operon transcriptional antiterminator|nr:HTH domain-containing protein [Erysipelotrichaceae bacterium]